MVNLTKKAITDSFMKLLGEQPFDKITVKDIVDDCGVNRNTFYYHYHDIYELLEEILRNETARISEEHATYESLQDAIMQSADFAFAHKKALYHLYNSLNRKDVEDYIEAAVTRGIRMFVEDKARGHNIPKESMEMIVTFYKCAMVGLILRWLDINMNEEADVVIPKMSALVDGTIDVMIANAEEAGLREKKF